MKIQTTFFLFLICSKFTCRKRIFNFPIRGYISPQLHESLTGGETIIKGYKKTQNPKKKRAPLYRIPKFWVPEVKKSVIYSEILNKHMSVLLTDRVVNLIHEHEGFDNYILQVCTAFFKKIITAYSYKYIFIVITVVMIFHFRQELVT